MRAPRGAPVVPTRNLARSQFRDGRAGARRHWLNLPAPVGMPETDGKPSFAQSARDTSLKVVPQHHRPEAGSTTILVGSVRRRTHLEPKPQVPCRPEPAPSCDLFLLGLEINQAL